MGSLNIAKIYSNSHQVFPKNIRNIRLYGGTWVDEKLYKSTLKQIRTVLPTLGRDKIYKIEKLCGKEFWGQLKKHDRLNAGKCLVDMVSKKLLSLDFAGKTKANARQYRLK